MALAHRLKFTGHCDEDEFSQICSKQDYWYHSFYFDNGFEVKGDYDIAANIHEYCFPGDMSGMRVLDIGTGSGWFATFFEQCGADVTTVDVRGKFDWDIFGRYHYPEVTTQKRVADRVLDDGRAIYDSGVSKGFWIMKEILGLRAEFVNARVYEISPALFSGATFDLVFMGAVLMHLRDPIGALMAARSVCRHRLIASSTLGPAGDDQVPIMAMRANHERPTFWWAPNKPCLMQWLKAADFSKVDIDKNVHLTVDAPYTDKVSGRMTGTNQTLTLVTAYV